MQKKHWQTNWINFELCLDEFQKFFGLKQIVDFSTRDDAQLDLFLLIQMITVKPAD